MKILISTPVYPTEDPKKISDALSKIFEKVSFKTSKTEISGESEDKGCLGYLKEKILAKRIKNTVRYLLLEYKDAEGVGFMLNKQTALQGKLNFVEEEYPLGNINVKIKTKNMEEIVDYITGF